MFEEYFKLKEQPFGASPDPRFLFRVRSHSEALASLYCGFFGNRCFTVLIAEPGMGKTTLLFEFLERIRDRARTAFLFNTLCDPNDILSFILYDLGVTPASSKVERHRQLDEILAAEARAGRGVVVVIDEAQNLSGRTLEAVRLLTNFETSRSKLLHVVLAGQPELADKLAAAEASQLNQRVSTLCRLTGLSPADTSAYIAHRLKVAGYSGGALFTASAIHLLSTASRGIPRVINTLCFNSLCLCQAQKAKQVDRTMVAEAIADLGLSRNGQDPHAPRSDGGELSSAPPLNVPEILVSSGKAAKYLNAAAFAMCATLVGIFVWHMHVLSLFPATVPPTISTNRQDSREGAMAIGISASQDRLSPVVAVPAEQGEAKAIGTSSAEVAQPTKVKVAAGDTLEGIVTAHLGSFDGAMLRKIQTLNPRITDPDHIETDSVIRLPAQGGPDPPNASSRLQP